MTLDAASEYSELDRAIGERVYMLMFRRRLTQVKLGRELSLNQAGIARRLRGETGWRATDLAATAHALNTTVAYLIGVVSDPECTPWDLNPEPTGSGFDEDVIIPIEWAFELRERREQRLELVIA